MEEKGKSIDGLMRHIRNSHNISINGSLEKQQLLNIGYYHGYKASRYIKDKSKVQSYSTFAEVKSVYDFDLELKTIFYSMLIRIETSLKNRMIDYLVSGRDTSIEKIYKEKLNGYKDKLVTDKNYNKYLKKNLELRSKIDETIAFNYSKGHPCIQHFFHSNKPLPLWGYFEVTTLGEFGNFISCMNLKDRIAFTDSLRLHHTGMNQNGRILENIVFCLNGLRNATMHNSIIFDCRFNNSNFSNQLKQYLIYNTKIEDIAFESIVDFLILLVFLMKKINVTKTELKQIIRTFNKSRESLYCSIPHSAYAEILGTDARNKINRIFNYV